MISAKQFKRGLREDEKTAEVSDEVSTEIVTNRFHPINHKRIYSNVIYVRNNGTNEWKTISLAGAGTWEYCEIVNFTMDLNTTTVLSPAFSYYVAGNDQRRYKIRTNGSEFYQGVQNESVVDTKAYIQLFIEYTKPSDSPAY